MKLSYIFSSRDFLKIPSSPLCYSMPKILVQKYVTEKPLSSYAMQRMRISTGNNDRFLKLWFEVSNKSLFYPRRYIPFSKGGEFRKWYGNWEYVLDYDDHGKELRRYPGFSGGSDEYYFKPGIVWTDLSTGRISVRDFPSGCIAGSPGPMMTSFRRSTDLYVMSFLNSKVSYEYTSRICVTLHFQWGDIARLPLAFRLDKNEFVARNALKNVGVEKDDWDSFETSWDFKKHPLI